MDSGFEKIWIFFIKGVKGWGTGELGDKGIGGLEDLVLGDWGIGRLRDRGIRILGNRGT